MNKILFVAGEGLPYAKSGGLADVIGSLPPALAQQGEEVAVVLPMYKSIINRFTDIEFIKEIPVQSGIIYKKEKDLPSSARLYLICSLISRSSLTSFIPMTGRQA